MGRRSRDKSRRSRSREVSKVKEKEEELVSSDEMESEPPAFPLYEIFQLVNAVLATLFIGLVFYGASEQWSTKTLGVLFSANITHLAASIILGIYVSFRGERSKVLYGFAMFLTITSLALSSGVFIFLSEV